jgi:signal transduction histidine kinase
LNLPEAASLKPAQDEHKFFSSSFPSVLKSYKLRPDRTARSPYLGVAKPMKLDILERLRRISPWHYIWIAVVCSELFTLLLSLGQGRLWWGGVSRETLIVGFFDSLLVPLLVAPVIIYLVKDAAELRKVNAQLQEMNWKLRELNKMKSDFVSVVSHELRTPLTTIKAFAELLTLKPDMPEQRRKHMISTINEESDRLKRLISDLLDLARIESGLIKMRREDVAIEDVIFQTVKNIGPLLESKGQRLTTFFATPLGSLFGDRDRLIQVLTNILSNAAKFTNAGGSIHINARQEEQPEPRIVVEVIDTGRGIPAGDLEHIFEKFHRSGDQLPGNIEGTGLGLSISRQIIELHKGRIWATSTEGKGSTFTLVLPICREVGGERGFLSGQT